MIVGGTLTAICHRILFDINSDRKVMDQDCRIFCMTIGFWVPIENALVEMTRIASARDVSARLDMIVRFWCDHTPRIMWEEAAYDALLTLVEDGVTRIDKGKGESLHQYVIQSEKSFRNLLQTPIIDSDNESVRSI